jgi:hypothetical protein
MTIHISTNNNKKLVVVGCSVSAGTGWDYNNPFADHKAAPELWINLCHKNINQFKNLDLVNSAVAAASNLQIFQSAITDIARFGSEIKYIICQWAKLHRHTISVGFEKWSTEITLPFDVLNDINTINVKIKKSTIKEYQQTIRALIHPQKEIVELLNYVNTINQLAEKFNITVYHVNSKLPWDQDYFVQNCNPNLLSSDLTEYTQKKILFSDYRSDLENIELYKKMFDDYTRAGGIAEESWINLYNPFYSPKNKVDSNYDNIHAGIISNQNFFNIVKNKLEK